MAHHSPEGASSTTLPPPFQLPFRVEEPQLPPGSSPSSSSSSSSGNANVKAKKSKDALALPESLADHLVMEHVAGFVLKFGEVAEVRLKMEPRYFFFGTMPVNCKELNNSM